MGTVEIGLLGVVGLQYIDKKRSCQLDLVDAQNTDYFSVHESCWDFTGQLVRQSLRVYLTEKIFTWPKKNNKFHS